LYIVASLNTAIVSRSLVPEVGMQLPEVDKRRFDRDGYLLIRQLFSEREVAAFRQAALAARGHKGDLLSDSRLRAFVLDERVLFVAREILGAALSYFGDSSCMFGPNRTPYHKDNADRYDGLAPDWSSDYTLLRFGLYLQDHASHSGGPLVRRGSHRMSNVSRGRQVYLDTRVGDLAVWSLRTTHAGGGVLLRWCPWPVAWHPTIAQYFPTAIKKLDTAERVAIFCTFGIGDHHQMRLIEQLKTRTYMVDQWKNSVYSEAALSEACARGLTIRDVRREIEGSADPNLGRYEDYVQLPYQRRGQAR
jgi:hypothetical protein